MSHLRLLVKLKLPSILNNALYFYGKSSNKNSETCKLKVYEYWYNINGRIEGVVSFC